MPGNAMDHLDQDFKTICILVSGLGGIGKTTLCGKLQSDKTITISIDHITETMSKLNDPILSPYFFISEPINYNIVTFSVLIDKNYPEYYAQIIFENIIKMVPKYPIIIIEGFTLSMPNIRKCLVETLERNNFVIWSLIRE